jgi:hypothetical protein
MAPWQTNLSTQDAAATDAKESRAEGAQEVDLARLNVERRGAIEAISIMAANLRAFLLSRTKAAEACVPAQDLAGGER